HIFTLSRKGYADAVVRRSFAPGSKSELVLELDQLPATLHVRARERGTVVTVEGADFGPAPVDIQRAAGAYRVVVRKDGFVPYPARVQVRAGEELNLEAALVRESTSVLKRWWFWAGAATVVAGGAVLTYALTRPDPEPAPYDGGNRGWVAFP